MGFNSNSPLLSLLLATSAIIHGYVTGIAPTFSLPIEVWLSPSGVLLSIATRHPVVDRAMLFVMPSRLDHKAEAGTIQNND